jgi:addiction module HigA family antidote
LLCFVQPKPQSGKRRVVNPQPETGSKIMLGDARVPRTPIHPGEILADELKELNLSAAALARLLDVPTNRVTQILNGERALTADTALRLARFFGTTAEFWLNLQKSYELRLAEKENGKEIRKRVKPLGELTL